MIVTYYDDQNFQLDHDQSPAFKFSLVFFAFKSCVRHPFSQPFVDRFGKKFGGLLIKGHVKHVSNFSQIVRQTAEMTELLKENNTNLNLKAGLCLLECSFQVGDIILTAFEADLDSKSPQDPILPHF